MKIETFEKTIEVEEFIEEYVNVDEFLECCKECENYDMVWSCPTYDFDPVDYWRKFKNLYVVGKKMILEEDEKENWETLMAQVKAEIGDELYALEEQYPNSKSLSAGNCKICGEGNCTRKTGEPCRYPEKMRYSIESLGGNVGLTASKLLGINLQWIEQGQIPDYFVLVGGLLY